MQNVVEHGAKDHSAAQSNGSSMEAMVIGDAISPKPDGYANTSFFLCQEICAAEVS